MDSTISIKQEKFKEISRTHREMRSERHKKSDREGKNQLPSLNIWGDIGLCTLDPSLSHLH